MLTNQNARPMLLALATVVLAVTALPNKLAAQSGPTVLYGCYVPNSGTAYRIKADGLPTECRSKNHVQFTWSLQGPPGPQGPVGPAGPQGVAGPSGPLSGRVLVTAQGTAPSNSIGTASATCPAGKKVLGGGFTGLTGNTTRVSHSSPKPTPTGVSDTAWEVILYNSDAFPLVFTVYAICANAE
jgi:hypothetical protein